MKFNNLIMAGLFLFLTILIALPSLSAFECQDQTEWWNVPCEMITPVVLCSENATIFDVNETTKMINVSMSLITSGVYNFTFPYGEVGNVSTYSIVLCDNSSGTIDIIWGYEESETNLYFWIVALLIFGGLLVFGIAQESHILIFFSGCIALILGIWIFASGNITVYNSITYWWVYPIAWITTGLGVILTVVPSYQLLQKEEGGDEE